MKAIDLTEKRIIEIVSRSFGKGESVLIGAGEDDCAVMDIGGGSLVLTTDMLHKKTDFPDMMTAAQIGWMSVAVNLSDIASMGARPIALLFSIGLPGCTEQEFIKELGEGMNRCASKYNVSIVGGDIDSHDELTICGSAIGTASKDGIVRRAGAVESEILCVTGSLGGAAAGLRIALGEASVPDSIEASLLKSLFEPEPKINEGLVLSEFATSMTDISDSLAISLYELSDASGVGFLIDEEKIPIAEGVKDTFEDPLDVSIYGGGDFELLFTIKRKDVASVLKKVPCNVIGEVTSGGIALKESGEEVGFRGYSHFK
ncbi:MAG: thiamine-phosphate kinase [Halobacteriota archaeon]|nr:thiamine-phosphate kinase [Halobacteriota archaeon]